MGSLLSDVNTLITKQVGDLSRLEHIKETIENNKQLYDSDRNYIDGLIEKHLFSNESTNDDIIPQSQETTESDDVSTNQIEDKMRKACSNCGKHIAVGQDFCTKCGQQSSSILQESNRSNFWYLLPIVFGLAGGIFGIVGGLIAYLVLRKSDPKKGKYCLIIGIIFTMIGVIFALALDSTIGQTFTGNENSRTEIDRSNFGGIFGTDIPSDIVKGLTGEQKRHMNFIYHSCYDNANMASLQSQSAYDVYLRKCLDSMDEKINTYREQNREAQTGNLKCGIGTTYDKESASCVIEK